MHEKPFWETTPLDQMSRKQWESLCDGCARCCLTKIQNDFTEDIYYTNVACHLLDESSCRCTRYTERQQLVPDCVVLASDQLGKFTWLPDTCAYRLLDEGKPLPQWHPLISGDSDSVHAAGMSVRGRTIAEDSVNEDKIEDFIIHWIPKTRAHKNA
ncbi:YcgN family cysteine cluster protein [Halieaceae bacterium IMCC14734]|uniref:UPF0260 protein EYC98_07185 n=1 Tax=Candidatus Litorirhabdus singularis TaxID=2518993 RepID=A0ABT3TF77_9GAMM|nr:YcgN family cysteine cluster protein [Candidatus Litorirhabdus singularis]MCX2980659.1 YcgN family cysteine cluster protein [Candidatus Litorirhabdus singularis]